MRPKIVNHGTICCEKCGNPLYDYVEYDDCRGGVDGEITHEYCRYEDDMCEDCRLEEESEEEGEEESENGSL